MKKPEVSQIKATYAYRWLCSFDMEDRVKRVRPPSNCHFLTDFLTCEKLAEYEKHRNLDWRDWNKAYRRVETLCNTSLAEKSNVAAPRSNRRVAKNKKGGRS